MSQTILIVDDDEITRHILRLYCIRKGYDIVEAENGLDALKILEQDLPDLLIIDELMPDMDGFSTVHQIRNELDIRQLPIVFLTPKNENLLAREGFDAGTQRFLNKPICFDTLARNIRDLTKTPKVEA